MIRFFKRAEAPKHQKDVEDSASIRARIMKVLAENGFDVAMEKAPMAPMVKPVKRANRKKQPMVMKKAVAETTEGKVLIRGTWYSKMEAEVIQKIADELKKEVEGMMKKEEKENDPPMKRQKVDEEGRMVFEKPGDELEFLLRYNAHVPSTMEKMDKAAHMAEITKMLMS